MAAKKKAATETDGQGATTGARAGAIPLLEGVDAKARALGSAAALILTAAVTLVAGCSKPGDGSAGSSTGRTTAPPATAAPAMPAAISTMNLTPAQVQKNAAALMGKKIQGEGLMYEYESGMLNGKMSFNAYVADDDKKTNSFKCTLSADPKIPRKTPVSFTGTWMGAHWLDDCRLTKK